MNVLKHFKGEENLLKNNTIPEIDAFHKILKPIFTRQKNNNIEIFKIILCN